MMMMEVLSNRRQGGAGSALDELDDDLSFLDTKKGIPTTLEEEEEEEEEGEAGGDGVGTTSRGRGPPCCDSSCVCPSLSVRKSFGREMRRAKRTSKSICEEGKFGGGGGCSITSAAVLAGDRSNKNLRRSRSGMGRGLPKKGGAGGKGTWGKLGCELELPWVDPEDPNYESENEESSLSLTALVPEMGEEGVRKTVEPLILEYFENNDADEVLYTLQEMLLNLGSRRWLIVVVGIELAMDHKPSHREMTSTLISDLYHKVISQRDIGKAFDYLLGQLPDLTLDIPTASDVLGNFMARTIADDCIPPKFLKSYKGSVESEEAKQALRKADTLLSMKHGMVRLDNVWGVGGGVRPVKYLVKKIILLLKEYLSSGDVEEATRCLQELEVPHFHHELVYEAVVMVIESMHEKTEEAMCRLLRDLFRTFVITIDQMRNGVERIYDNMPEISIDVPAAYMVLERFVMRCRASGFITDDLVRKMPSRGRKRFVSEGDGGQIKQNWWQ